MHTRNGEHIHIHDKCMKEDETCNEVQNYTWSRDRDKPKKYGQYAMFQQMKLDVGHNEHIIYP